MRKMILQKILVFLLSLGVASVICLTAGMSATEWLTAMTFLVIVLWSYNLFDELFLKVFWYRYAITKRFLKLEGLFTMALICFAVSAFATSSLLPGLIMFVLCLVFLAVGIVLYCKYYNDADYESFEIDALKWIGLLKSFETMSAKEIETKVYEFLRYYPKGNVLEAPLCIARPVDPAKKMRSIKEMMAQMDALDVEGTKKISEAVTQVHNMIADYCRRHGKEN